MLQRLTAEMAFGVALPEQSRTICPFKGEVMGKVSAALYAKNAGSM